MSNLHALKKPWQQWESETDLAYSYFVSYMEMGADRSLTKVVQKHNKKPHYKTQLGKWSSKYDWVDRCKAHDEHIALQHVENQEVIQKKARSEILRRLPEAVDQLYKIALSDNHDRMQAIEIIMSQAGMIQADEEGGKNKTPTYQQINNYFDSLDK